MVKAHFKDAVCFSSRGEREGGGTGQWGAQAIPPSITDKPIIKDKLQYTSLRYANSKLDRRRKISIAIFCISEWNMSAFRTGYNTCMDADVCIVCVIVDESRLLFFCVCV